MFSRDTINKRKNYGIVDPAARMAKKLLCYDA